MVAATTATRPRCFSKSGRRMGHAGAILGGAEDTAAASECGIHVVDSPAEIGDTMLKALGGK